MKKLLTSVMAFFGFLVTANSQTIAPVRQSAIGISFTLTDFITAERIRSTSLKSVLDNNEWAKVKEMSPGFGLSYYKGVLPKIDFAATFNATFVDMPLPDKPDDGNTHFLGELDASAQFKLVNENYWFIPYADIGVGAHVYKSYYGAFLPIGIGFRVNFFDEAGINVNSQYRIPVTPETANYHFFHTVGIYGIIGPKKEAAKVAPVVPAVVPKDSDGDGIIDANDKCPNVPGSAKYDGCPIQDSDKDGINDEEDKCPTVPGVARYQGCPIPDTDKDGINDEEDKCPNQAGVARYEGCPVPDTDGDSVNDEDDKCPTVPGVARYQGCPVPDSDNDGVNDEEDKCPNLAGTVANQGCPEVSQEIVTKTAYAARNIFFETGKATLLKKSYPALSEVAKILSDNPQLKLAIDGHTDNVGNDAFNQDLSEKRAAAVKTYLVSKGVDESRLAATGYGETQPVADNKTTAGRQKNRRVEMKPSYY